MAAIIFDSVLQYVPYLNVTLVDGAEKRTSCGCEKPSCDTCSPKEKCSCCAYGTVQVRDGGGQSIGCLSLEEANTFYNDGGYQCDKGYVQVFSETGVGILFVGCMTQEQYNQYVTDGYIADGLLINTPD